MKTESDQCPICLAREGGHAVNCPRMTLEEAKKQLAHYYKLWRGNEQYPDAARTTITSLEERLKRWEKYVELWAAKAHLFEGKYRIVCHENNQLRKKLKL